MMRRTVLLVIAGLIAVVTSAVAQAGPFGRSWFRVTGGADHVTGDLGDWAGVEARTATVLGRTDLFLAEARWQRAFGDEGVYGGAGLRHAFGSDWIAMASAGGGSGEFFLPEFRADLAIQRVLPGRRVVATAGFTWVRSKDVYRDRAAYLSLTGYWSGVAVEAGGRLNWSNPGSEQSARGLAAITVGRDAVRRLVIRGNAGRESYQLVAAGGALRSFSSQEVAAEYEEWLGPGWSLVVGGEYYHNPFYRRTGGRLGVARHW